MNRFTTLLLGLYLAAPLAFTKDLPRLTAETGHPVVPELMGGCSMKCAFPWKTDAVEPGDGRSYNIAILNDERAAPPGCHATPASARN